MFEFLAVVALLWLASSGNPASCEEVDNDRQDCDFCNGGEFQDAALLAKSLVEKRLVACVNLVPGELSSWYWWEGKVTEDQEVLLMMKTSRDKFAALEKEVLRAAFLRCARSHCSPDRGGFEELSELD